MSNLTQTRLSEQTQNFLYLLALNIHPDFKPVLDRPYDWDCIFSMAKAHNVLPLIYEQAIRLCPGCAGDDIQTRVFLTVMRQSGMTQTFLDLYKQFAARGLYPIVMKGIVCRNLYGELCDHRPSGDEDILIQKKDFPLAKEILESSGYITDRNELSDSQLELMQEVSFFDKKTDLHIELHLNPLGNNISKCSKLNKYFENVFENYIVLNIGGVELHTMNHTDHLLFLICHAFKHFLNSGFGIRQAMDILMYYEKYASDIDHDYIKLICEKNGMLVFFSDIMYIGNKYMGFDHRPFCSENCPEDMLNDMMQSGVFGIETQEQRTAINMTQAAISGGKASSIGRLKTLFRTIFPSRRQMIDVHPELLEKPYLTPVRWVQRWIRFLKHNKVAGRSLAAKSMEISNRRIKLLKKYKVI